MCNETYGSQLTDKQRYQRDYYKKNKAKICADKRRKYSENKKPSPVNKQEFNTSISKKRTFKPAKNIEQPKDVDAQRVRVRRSVEDVRLARELGISLSDLD